MSTETIEGGDFPRETFSPQKPSLSKTDSVGKPIFTQETEEAAPPGWKTAPKKPESAPRVTVKISEILQTAREHNVEEPTKIILKEFQKGANGNSETVSRALDEILTKGYPDPRLLSIIEKRWPNVYLLFLKERTRPQTASQKSETAPQAPKPEIIPVISPPEIPAPEETTPPQTETPAQPPTEDISMEDSPKSTPKKPGFFSRLFGGSKPPAPPPAPPAPSSSPKPKSNGFLSNLLNSNLGKWGKRLAIIGLAVRWGGHTNETQDTESKSAGIRTEQGFKIDAKQNAVGIDQKVREIINKAALQEKLKIGTVGSDSEHNALVKLVQAQIEHSPQDFGFDGDASELSHWANELAKDTAKAHGITGLGGEWRLTSAAIGELSVLVDVGEDGRPAISYHNAHDGSLLENDQLSKFFYQHDVSSHDTGGHETGSHETKDTSKTTQSSETSDAGDDMEAHITQDLVDRNQDLESKLWTLADTDNDNLVKLQNTYEHAYDVWQESQKSGESSADVPEAETLNALDALDEAARNLEVAIEHETLENQHQEFISIFGDLATANSSSLRGIYESYYQSWKKAENNTNDLDAPLPIAYMEERVKITGETLKSLMDLELKNIAFATKINQIKNPNRRISDQFKSFYAKYQVAYLKVAHGHPTEKNFPLLVNDLRIETENIDLLMSDDDWLK